MKKVLIIGKTSDRLIKLFESDGYVVSRTDYLERDKIMGQRWDSVVFTESYPISKEAFDMVAVNLTKTE